MKVMSIIAAAAMAMFLQAGTAVAGDPVSAGGPLVVAPGPTFAALGSAPAEMMAPGEMKRVVGAGLVTVQIVVVRIDDALDFANDANFPGLLTASSFGPAEGVSFAQTILDNPSG